MAPSGSYSQPSKDIRSDIIYSVLPSIKVNDSAPAGDGERRWIPLTARLEHDYFINRWQQRDTAGRKH